MKKKDNRGGAREGAGRKPGEPTTTIGFKVPLKYAEDLKEPVRKKIRQLVKKFSS